MNLEQARERTRIYSFDSRDNPWFVYDYNGDFYGPSSDGRRAVAMFFCGVEVDMIMMVLPSSDLVMAKNDMKLRRRLISP